MKDLLKDITHSILREVPESVVLPSYVEVSCDTEFDVERLVSIVKFGIQYTSMEKLPSRYSDEDLLEAKIRFANKFRSHILHGIRSKVYDPLHNLRHNLMLGGDETSIKVIEEVIDAIFNNEVK